ncbi:MAG: acyltransferase family protein [Treponema sp.]|uniref:acyltransferase family protein n=1 Tax=Treponema sp. TaxID=166 RepID=UPI0034594062|nr:acyltransferase family protein [Treponema sp.]
MKEKNYTIEFLRFFFTIGVVIGHTWCVFYQRNNPSYEIQFHNACVDFFFVLSGFFMAAHFKNNYNSDGGGVCKI